MGRLFRSVVALCLTYLVSAHIGEICSPDHQSAAEEYHNIQCPQLLKPTTNLGKYVRCVMKAGFEFPRAAEECSILYNNGSLADMYFMLKSTCGSPDVESATEIICCVMTHELKDTLYTADDKISASRQCIKDSQM